MSEDAPRAGGEAARLLAAAQDWLVTAAPHVAPVDAEGRTCPCPLCRAIAAVRDADPDEVGRWVDAALAGLGDALRDLVPEEPPEPQQGDTGTTPEPPVLTREDPVDAEEQPRVRRIPVRTEDPEEGSAP